ncbi:MAG: TonB-dependent receptor [Sphingobacteriales bacterium]|nr:MAG: TonB-dependent receptor [Sphingobacteriales bacterium]
MRILVAFLSVLVLLQSTQAQSNYSIQGKVINQQGEPIQGASVVLLNGVKGTVTDGMGAFTLLVSKTGTYTLAISSIGYAEKLMTVIAGTASTTLNIILTPSSQVLDELLVSAEKQDEKLQKVASAITTIPARQIREYRLWDIREISGIVPNLYSANSGDYRNVTSVRGITTTSYEQAVATYIDGVNQFSLDTYIPQLLDVERIEILRGPQGTLYGRNAMGGVISIITKKPTNKTDLYAEATIGNYNQQRYMLALKTPLIKDKLFIGAAGLFEKRNGYYTNAFTGQDFDAQQRFMGNYYLSYVPSARFSATLNVKHSHNANQGAFPLNADKTSALEEPFLLNQNAIATMNDNVLNTSLVLKYNSGAVRFQSISAWQSNSRIYDAPIDGDFSTLDAIAIVNDYGNSFNKVKVFTQEFRFQSRDLQEQKIRWNAGLFFFHQDNPTRQGTYFGKDAPLLGLPDSEFTIISNNLGKNIGASAYGQLNWSLTEKLELIGGLRFDYEQRKLTVSGEYEKAGNSFPTQEDTSATANFTAISPKAGLQFSFTTERMMYLIYSRGYRAGGFTSLGSDPSQPPLAPYDPEFSNNIELGWKQSWDNQRYRLNANLFYTFVNSVQTPTLILPDAITVIRNAGKLNSKGAELEFAASPVKGVELVLNGGLTDATYTELTIPKDGQAVDLSGNKQIFTPAYTAMGVAQYSYPISSKIRLSARVEVRLFGKQYFDLANSISQDAYNLLHARVGATLGKADFYVWMRNLANTTFIAYGYDFGGVHLGNPRTFGATASIRL